MISTFCSADFDRKDHPLFLVIDAREKADDQQLYWETDKAHTGYWYEGEKHSFFLENFFGFP